MDGRCIFCMIVRGELPAHKVHEDDSVLAFLDIHPSAPGHTLIIPKLHATRIEDMPEEDADALFEALHRLVGKIQAAVDAPSSTIGINNGPESGQEVPHVHIHIIPRFRGDRGGIIQRVTRSGYRPNQTEMHEIAERIKELAGTA